MTPSTLICSRDTERMLSISRLTAGKPAWRELPFYSLLDFEVSSMYNKWYLLENDTFVKYLADNK